MEIWPSEPFPLGATWDGRGTSFSVFSSVAERIELCLFDERGRETRIELPEPTAGIFHAFVPGVGPGQRYGYRVHGPYEPERGARCNPHKLLIDPYARALAGSLVWSDAVHGYVGQDPNGAPDGRDSAPFVPRSLVIDPAFDWGDDVPPRTPWHDTVVYELHVKGFTARMSGVPQELRGTYAGLAHERSIAYLRELGVTAIELLPVQAFVSEQAVVERGLTNYWGYSPIGYFAPHAAYASTRQPGAEVVEIKRMVKALHAAGIEVILDVVYNHTAEGPASGPTLCFRGLDNAAYYWLDERDPRRHVDTTGCGNSLHARNPRALALIMDSLRYWVNEVHVDGFRFDLASTLVRGPSGFDPWCAFLAAVHQDPVLQRVKLIAEPWDLGPGGHNTGGFPAPWAEWNDRYRDAVRELWNGRGDVLPEVARRLSGSADLFRHNGRTPQASVNFVTAHDGFTLRDLVSYDHKHNASNGEHNRDGESWNRSWNCGVEGETDRADVLELRARQQRNFFATLLLSQGVPMITAGDELGRTQRGNNNAYCHDDEISWLDWDHVDVSLRGFVRELLSLRRERSLLRARHWPTGRAEPIADGPRIEWFRPDGEHMNDTDWHVAHARVLGMLVAAPRSDEQEREASLLVIFNASSEAVRFTLPDAGFRYYRALLDTTSARISVARGALAVHTDVYVAARSLRVLEEVVGAYTTTSMRPPAPPPSSGSTRPREVAVSNAPRPWLAQLADRAGIDDHYYTLQGSRVDTPDHARVLLLSAMGLSCDSEAAAEQSVLAWDALRASRPLSPLRVLEPNEPTTLCFERAAVRDAHEVRVELRLESGELHVLEGALDDQARFAFALPDGRALPLGYHGLRCTLRTRSGQELMAEQQWIAVPTQAMEAVKGATALMAQLYSVRGSIDRGVGDFGTLRELLELTAHVGAQYVLINPVCALDLQAREVSPYSPSSRLALYPLYADVDALQLQGVPGLHPFQHTLQLASRGARIDYAAVLAAKRGLLAASFDRHHQGGAVLEAEPEVDAVTARARERYAVFAALADHFGAPEMSQWPEPFRDPDSKAVAEFCATHPRELALHRYVQRTLDAQLAAVDAHGKQLGARIAMDLPVGSVASGADVWSNPGLFARGVSLGAPPDDYSADGQSWGLAPIVPWASAEQGHGFFRSIVRQAMRHAGALRIDHVMGLRRQFWVPHGERATSGAYVRCPEREWLGIVALESVRSGCVVLGEDLGTVPDGLREELHRRHVLRSHVMFFERYGDGGFVDPVQYSELSMSSANTHDLPPLRAMWEERDLVRRRDLGLLSDSDFERARIDREHMRRALLGALRHAGLLPADDTPPSHEALSRAVYAWIARSPARLVAIALDDLAAEAEGVSVPGTGAEAGNWRRRMTRTLGQLSGDEALAEWLRALTRLRREAR